jgi:hypothetical protein
MRGHNKHRKDESAPNLRPPTMMIDLLFGALMLFAFQMGAPTAKTVIPHEVDLPTSEKISKAKPAPLLALKPVKRGEGNWRYLLPDGRELNSEEIIVHIKDSNRTPVLIVSKGARVQDYVDAEQPLRQAGLKAGLAVEIIDGEEK